MSQRGSMKKMLMVFAMCAVVLSACGGTEVDTEPEVAASTATTATTIASDDSPANDGTAANAVDGSAEAADDGTADDSGASGGGGSGSATLVVGDHTYQFDSFVCAFGYSSTQSATFSFSSNFIGEVDGVRVQMQLDVEDPSGGDRLTGDGVVQRIHLDDISDFENPAISVSSNDLAATFDGDNITAEGTFWDAIADPGRLTPLPGTFEATCGAGSRR